MPVYLRLVNNSWNIKREGKSEKVDLESAYSDDFLEELNAHAFVRKSDYSNEIFLYYYLKYKELETSVVDVSDASFSGRSRITYKSILFRLSRANSFRIGVPTRISFFCHLSLSFLLSLIAMLLLSVIWPFLLLAKAGPQSRLTIDKIGSCKRIFLIRSDSGFSRAKGFFGDQPECVVLWDDYSSMRNTGDSIYSVLRSVRFPSFYLKTFRYVIRDLFLLLKDAQRFLGAGFSFSVLADYWKRVPQKALYEVCLDEVLRASANEVGLYSGEKEDRFALLQTRCCNKEGRHLTCLPHGLEYGLKFPGGLCGDRFYCFSENARKILNSIYRSDKFVYSEEVANKMLGVQNEKCDRSIERICFFTEPRDQIVNFEIIDSLNEMGVIFFIKLHPLENADSYKEKFPGISILNELDDALNSSICLARKSTVLIEAAQRGSQAIAVLVNKKDRFYANRLFPSLSSEKISMAHSFNELRKVLMSNRSG